MPLSLPVTTPLLALTLGLALLLSAAPTAHACSSFTFRCENTGSLPISGHTFDKNANCGLSLAALPRGYMHAALPLCQTCEPRNISLPLASVYLAVSTGRLYGSPVMGMNEAGLAVGGHSTDIDFSTAARWAYRADRPGVALAFPDLMPYLLGTASTVGEVAALFEPAPDAQGGGGVQVTTDFYSPLVRAEMAALGMAPEAEDETSPLAIPIHISVYDATGAGVLLEWAPGEPMPRVYRNVSVVTNMPSYPQQLRNLDRWLAAVKNISLQTDDLLQSAYESLFQPYPGGFGSSSRFVRLSMLTRDVCQFDPTPWPSEPNWSPEFSGVEPYPGRPALAQADGILRTVDIVRGAVQLGGITQVAALRDHVNRMLYFKTPLTARYQGLNISAIAETATVPMALPLWNEEEGYLDVTAALEPLPVPLGPLSEAQGALLGPLIDNTEPGGA